MDDMGWNETRCYLLWIFKIVRRNLNFIKIIKKLGHYTSFKASMKYI